MSLIGFVFKTAKIIAKIVQAKHGAAAFFYLFKVTNTTMISGFHFDSMFRVFDDVETRVNERTSEFNPNGQSEEARRQ